MIIEYQVDSTLIFINQSILSIQTNTHQLLPVGRQDPQLHSRVVARQEAQLLPQLGSLPQIVILKDDIYIIFCNSVLAPPSTICVTNNSATLYNNQFIYSPATQVYAAGMLNNTFGIYKAHGYQNVTTSAIWRASQIHNSSVECFLNIQTDRNLVVYTTNLAVMWAASVPNSGSGDPFCLKMLDSGNLIWIDRNATIIWQTNTVQTG
ncbi:unnamed protein product [Adineta steineri]|uniref:Bulb-type lectin domain-containing protein n=1 Tax=Adineta steineri TaxID=433720 RepID=A0A819DPI9_9BILA|nr:unnamed protein product [Adineta steineri]